MSGEHEAQQTGWLAKLLSQLGAQAKKAWAGGVAGATTAIAGISFAGFWADGQLDTTKVAQAAGAIVTGFVGGFLIVFFGPRNHPPAESQEPQPAQVPVSDIDLSAQ